MNTTQLFEGFDAFHHSRNRNEARERWGHTEAHAESARRNARYGGMRHPSRSTRVLLFFAGIALLQLACSRAPTDSAEGPRPSIFAPELGIALSEMERTETGLYVRTLREGTGPVAQRGQRVRVHYEGWLPDGTKFDSSRDRLDPLEVPIGMGMVIDGWDQGVVGMRVGELRRLVVPPELAYGEEGAAGVIPPNTTLVFEIELLGVR